jgi:tRNA pseudouridine38-40 synthase
MRERFALSVELSLDVDAMRHAAQVFVGRHDFSAFGGRDVQPVRTLHRVEVGKQGQLITVQVVGDAFLRGMVRRIVAALLRVGLGRADADAVRNALDGRRAAFDGEAAPAHGLTLWKVPMGPPHERQQDEQQEQNGQRDKEQPKGRDEQK